MSHVTGSVIPQNPAFQITASGGSPGTSNYTFSPPQSPEQGGTKLLILHFTGVHLPAASSIEVDLGYDTDVFTSASGSDFWTRPVNVYAHPAGVPIKLVASSNSARASIDEYGRGERHAGSLDPTSYSNCDPFQKDATYTEPRYDPSWYGANPPAWENVRRIPSGDIRRDIAASVGMVMHVDGPTLSTCTVTLVGPDLVIAAGHCITSLVADAASGSVFFGYVTEADGSRPAGYHPTVAKVTEVIAQCNDGIYDYCLMRIHVPTGGLGLPIRQMRHDVPGIGERVFGLHHPNGAVMKVSTPSSAPLATVTGYAGNFVDVSSGFAISGGSSGSALFDMAGRVIGVLSHGDPQGTFTGSPSPLAYCTTSSMLSILQQPPHPPVSRDVVLLIDKSGSMSLPGDSGRPKIAEARDAASLFVQLVRANTGSKIGAVSFSTASNIDHALADVTAAYKTALVGPPPYNSGLIGALTPNGSTSIGAGLADAQAALNVGGGNAKSVLLLTDGLQNTPPWIAAVEGGLGTTAVQAIGYGTPGSLEGAVLTALAAAHHGQYVRADSTLRLEKFFAQAFGAIFEAGLLQDPEYELKENQAQGATMPFDVCGEEAITVVLGWDNVSADLALTVTTPLGQVVDPSAVDVIADAGQTWAFLRIPLPHLAERDGTWNATVYRPGEGGREFPQSARGPAARYFLSVIAAGGPQLRRVPQSTRYYTGDVFQPLVYLGYDTGGTPENAAVTATVTGPDRSAGSVLSDRTLGDPRTIGGDTVPSRQATLLAAEEAGGESITQVDVLTAKLGGEPSDTGRFEAGGIFGAVLPDVLKVDGDYTVHAVATYGEGCTARREVVWSLHVRVGIDAASTAVQVTSIGPGQRGLTFTPQDRYANKVGPGAAETFEVAPTPGTTIVGTIRDNADGSYTVPLTWDPSLPSPGLIVSQPGRAAVTITGKRPRRRGCLPWIVGLALPAAIVGLLIWLLS